MGKIIYIVLLLGISLSLFGCDSDYNGNNMEKVEQLKESIKEKLPEGTPRSDVEKFLDDNNIEFTFVGSEKKIYSIIPKVGRYRIIYETSLLMRFQFDNSDLLKSVEFEFEHTGL